MKWVGGLFRDDQGQLIKGNLINGFLEIVELGEFWGKTLSNILTDSLLNDFRQLISTLKVAVFLTLLKELNSHTHLLAKHGQLVK